MDQPQAGADPSWVYLQSLSDSLNIPVYTQPNWTYSPAGAWQGPSPVDSVAIPKMIMIRAKWAKPAMKPLRGQYLRKYRVVLGWQTLLHEYTHTKGFNHGDMGSNDYQKHVIDSAREIIPRLRMPKYYKKWLLREVVKDIKNTTFNHPE